MCLVNIVELRLGMKLIIFFSEYRIYFRVKESFISIINKKFFRYRIEGNLYLMVSIYYLFILKFML